MVSVIICTYNRATHLRSALDSLRQMCVPPVLAWELIIVDNNSTDHTRAVIEEFAQSSGLQVRYVFERQQGLSHARNAGIQSARGDLLAFTDDDATVSSQWLAEIADGFSRYECIGVGGRCIPAWGQLQKPEWLMTSGPYRTGSGILLDYDLGTETKPTRTPPWGLNMAFRRIAFERYGLFRTDLGISGTRRLFGEDTEFGKRLILGGEMIVYLPSAIVHHPVAPHRVTKEYFLSHYLNEGRSRIREERWPSDAVLYLGVPRYLFREMGTNGFRMLLTSSADQRFYYQLKTYDALGQILEARALRREKGRAVRGILFRHG